MTESQIVPMGPKFQSMSVTDHQMAPGHSLRTTSLLQSSEEYIYKCRLKNTHYKVCHKKFCKRKLLHLLKYLNFIKNCFYNIVDTIFDDINCTPIY